MAKDVDKTGRAVVITTVAASATLLVCGVLGATNTGKDWFDKKTKPDKDTSSVAPDGNPPAPIQTEGQQKPPEKPLPEGEKPCSVTPKELRCGEDVVLTIGSSFDGKDFTLAIDGTKHSLSKTNDTRKVFTHTDKCREGIVTVKTDDKARLSGTFICRDKPQAFGSSTEIPNRTLAAGIKIAARNHAMQTELALASSQNFPMRRR